MQQEAVYHKVLPCPEKPDHLPADVKWLSGEGCGSWFSVQRSLDKFMFSRFSPEGKLECRGLFNQVSGIPINLTDEFEYTYLSHCAEINIIQKEQKLSFKLISKC